MKPFRLSRRTLLKGLGAAVALPTLEAMLNSSGTAFAQNQPFPKRYVAWFWGNGVLLPKWTPAATGANWALTEQLQPLANVKSYINVVSGYQVKTPDLRGHHNGCAAMLSAAPFIPLPAGSAPYNSKFGAKSLDQVAADVLCKNTTFTQGLQIAVSKRVTTGEGPTLQYMSHRDPDSPMPPEFNPASLFTKLFSSFTPKDPTDPRERLRASVLDAVNDDAKRLQGRLGATDRARLDQHLTAIGDVRKQILALPPTITSSCQQMAKVTNTNSDVNGVEQYETVNQIFSDMLALAFSCDLTRVATYQFTGSVGGQVFANLGQTDNEHSITHDSTLQSQVNDAITFTIKNFAYLVEKLKGSIEGSGNVLDNSVLLATSDVSEGLTHSVSDYPILVAGRGSGYLKYPGVHVRSTSNENVSNVLFTLMKAAGTGVTSVGMNEGYSNTPCLGIQV